MRWLVGIVVIVGIVWFGYRATLGYPDRIDGYSVSIDDQHLSIGVECGWSDLKITETSTEVQVRARSGGYRCREDEGLWPRCVQLRAPLGDREVVEVGGPLSATRTIARSPGRFDHVEQSCQPAP